MIIWLLLVGVIVLLDQLTKAYVEQVFRFGERLNVLPVFDITLLYNKGAAFSFWADFGGVQRWLLIGIGISASTFIVWLMRRSQEKTRLMFALALILAGAVGNVIDRVVNGHVIDFLLFYWRDWYYPAFNVADIAITCGAILLLLEETKRGLRARPEK